MKRTHRARMLLASLAYSGLLVAGPSETPRHFQPMYGGVTPSEARAQLTEEDRALLGATSGLDAARSSESWVKVGLQRFYQNNHNEAMRAFNFAWLTAPSNPDATVGLGVVIGTRDAPCKGAELIDRGTALGTIDASLAVDALGTLGSCALQAESKEEQRSAARYCGAVHMILGAPKSVPNPRTDAYFSVAITALAACGYYDEAWKQVKLMRDTSGHEPPANLTATLRQLAPEPTH